jgi:hypothetical protein
MNITEFRDYLRALVVNSGNEAVAGVEFYDVAGNELPVRDLAVRCTDGVTLYLRTVMTAPPGGDKPDGTVVTKSEPGVRLIDGGGTDG